MTMATKLCLLLVVVASWRASVLGQISNYCQLFREHTLCVNQGLGRTCGGQLHFRGVSDADASLIVALHNQFRSRVALGQEGRGSPGPQPQASNIRVLEWDFELANVAQSHADQCIFEHECSDCRRVSRFGVGQNLFLVLQSHFNENIQWERAIRVWFDEVVTFNSRSVTPFRFSTPAGHYTMMMWWNTHKIGCGFTMSRDGVWWKKLYTCNYGPGGNIIFSEMYRPGFPCSACPGGTTCSIQYPGLCEDIRAFDSTTGLLPTPVLTTNAIFGFVVNIDASNGIPRLPLKPDSADNRINGFGDFSNINSILPEDGSIAALIEYFQNRRKGMKGIQLVNFLRRIFKGWKPWLVTDAVTSIPPPSDNATTSNTTISLTNTTTNVLSTTTQLPLETSTQESSTLTATNSTIPTTTATITTSAPITTSTTSSDSPATSHTTTTSDTTATTSTTSSGTPATSDTTATTSTTTSDTPATSDTTATTSTTTSDTPATSDTTATTSTTTSDTPATSVTSTNSEITHTSALSSVEVSTTPPSSIEGTATTVSFHYQLPSTVSTLSVSSQQQDAELELLEPPKVELELQEPQKVEIELQEPQKVEIELQEPQKVEIELQEAQKVELELSESEGHEQEHQFIPMHREQLQDRDLMPFLQRAGVNKEVIRIQSLSSARRIINSLPFGLKPIVLYRSASGMLTELDPGTLLPVSRFGRSTSTTGVPENSPVELLTCDLDVSPCDVATVGASWKIGSSPSEGRYLEASLGEREGAQIEFQNLVRVPSTKGICLAVSHRRALVEGAPANVTIPELKVIIMPLDGEVKKVPVGGALGQWEMSRISFGNIRSPFLVAMSIAPASTPATVAIDALQITDGLCCSSGIC